MAKELEEPEIKKKKNTRAANSKDDTLLEKLADELNKSNKDGGKVAFFLDEKEDPSTVSEWISTGSSILDLAISNRPNGGLPVGRIVEFNGLEGSGKSLLSAHIVADTQKKGGKAIFIDTENSAAPEFWQSLGVDLSKDKLLYTQAETVEEIFERIEKAILYIRKDNPNLLLTIIVDSVAGASTKVELESDHGKDGWATTKAIIISKAMRKITTMIGRQKVLIVFTNQLRINLGAPPGADKYVISGGKGIPYHSSVRVRLSSVKKLKNKKEIVIGNICKAVVTKNRMGPPNRITTFNIYYDSGIADYSSWLDVLKTYNMTSNAGPNGTKYIALDGKEYTFLSADFVKLLNDNSELKSEIYSRICDSLIMKYQDPNSKIEDVTEADDDEAVADNDEE